MHLSLGRCNLGAIWMPVGAQVRDALNLRIDESSRQMPVGCRSRTKRL